MRADEYFKRMVKLYKPLKEYIEHQEKIIPLLVEAVEATTADVMAGDQTLSNIQKELQSLLKSFSALKGHISMTGAATGHLMEEHEEAAKVKAKFTDMVTLAQWPDVAGRLSPEFWQENLTNVQLPVLEEALEKVGHERFLLIDAALTRAKTKRREAEG